VQRCNNNKIVLKKLPSELITLVQRKSAHFGSSSLRMANFRELQKDFSEDEFSDNLKVLPFFSPSMELSFKVSEENSFGIILKFILFNIKKKNFSL